MNSQDCALASEGCHAGSDVPQEQAEPQEPPEGVIKLRLTKVFGHASGGR